MVGLPTHYFAEEAKRVETRKLDNGQVVSGIPRGLRSGRKPNGNVGCYP